LASTLSTMVSKGHPLKKIIHYKNKKSKPCGVV
jgi:hypothetical protein